MYSDHESKLLLDLLFDGKPFTGYVALREKYKGDSISLTVLYRLFFSKSVLRGLSVTSKGRIGLMSINEAVKLTSIGIRDIIVKILLTPVEKLTIRPGNMYRLMFYGENVTSIAMHEWENAVRLAKELARSIR